MTARGDRMTPTWRLWLTGAATAISLYLTWRLWGVAATQAPTHAGPTVAMWVLAVDETVGGVFAMTFANHRAAWALLTLVGSVTTLAVPGMFGWVPVVAVEGAPSGDAVAWLAARIPSQALHVSCGVALVACMAVVVPMNRLWKPTEAHEAT